MLRPNKGTRPSMKAGEYTRANYKEWVREFRVRRSDKTLALRPQTYRLVFKRELGVK